MYVVACFFARLFVCLFVCFCRFACVLQISLCRCCGMSVGVENCFPICLRLICSGSPLHCITLLRRVLVLNRLSLLFVFKCFCSAFLVLPFFRSLPSLSLFLSLSFTFVLSSLCCIRFVAVSLFVLLFVSFGLPV